MVRKIISILAAIAITLVVLLPPSVMAHCPLCTAAVGTGLITARYFGIDDSLVGVWIGALIISTALWSDKILSKKIGKIFLQKWILIIAFSFLTILPLFAANLINFQNTFAGVDRLLFGTALGMAVSLAGFYISPKIRGENNRPVVPFQTIILTMLILVLSNLVLGLAM